MRLLTMHAAATPARWQVQLCATVVRCYAQPRSGGWQNTAQEQQLSPATSFSDKAPMGVVSVQLGAAIEIATAEDEAVLSRCAGSRAQVDERSYASGHLWTLSSNAPGLRWPDTFATHCCGDQSCEYVCGRDRGRTVAPPCRLYAVVTSHSQDPRTARTTNSAQR